MDWSWLTGTRAPLSELQRTVDQFEVPEYSGLVTRDLAQIMDGMIQLGSTVPAQIQTLPAVAAAVRLIASTVDQLELRTTSGPTPLWLESPRTYGSAFDQGDLVGYIIDSMVIHGRGYVMCTQVAQDAWLLQAVDPNYVQVRLGTEGVVTKEYLIAGETVPVVPPRRVSKGRGPYLLPVPYRVSVAHPEGTTPLTEAAATLYGHVATERHAATMFDGGTYIGGLLTTTDDISTTQALDLQTRWVEGRLQGKVAVLGNGLTYRNELGNATDLQLVEARSFNQSVVWAMLGIPQAYMGSSLMGGQSSLSYANAQDNRRLFADNCLRAFTTQIADALSTLMPPGRNDQENVSVYFDYDEWEGRASEPDNSAVVDAPAGD